MNDPREGAALGAIDLDKNDGGIADDRGVGHKIMYDLLFARALLEKREALSRGKIEGRMF